MNFKDPTPPQLGEIYQVAEVQLENDAYIEDIAGGYVNIDGDVTDAEISGSKFVGAQFTSSLFERLNVVDTVFDNCELSGASFLVASRFLRVAFNECRMSGFVGKEMRSQDVHFKRCKLDGTNFRMSAWDRVLFEDCELQDADFMGASFETVQFRNCRMQYADFSQVKIESLSLHGSDLTNLSGASYLRGATIGTDQVLSLAMPVFNAMDITIEDI